MRSSWAGAMGLTQFLPSEFYDLRVDFDHNGRVDIFHSVPDALASAARQLAGKGWEAGKGWAMKWARRGGGLHDRRARACHAVAEWLKRGYVPPTRCRPMWNWPPRASLFLPAGTYGPAFLTPKNFYVFKEYNFPISMRCSSVI